MGRSVGSSVAWKCAWVCMFLFAGCLSLWLGTARAATAGSGYGVATPPFGSNETSADFTEKSGLSVEQSTGRVFVANPYGATVNVYAPDPFTGGTLLTTIPMGGYLVAADPTNGSVYVHDGSGPIHKFTSDGAPVPTYTEDLSYAPPANFALYTSAMAVDPTTHDLLAINADKKVNRLSPTGAVLSTFDGSDTADGQLDTPGSIAVGPAGDIYVVDRQTPSRVERFDSAGRSLGKLPTHGAPRLVAVNPSTGEVVVAADFGLSARPKIEAFTSAGTPTFSVRFPAGAVQSIPTGLGVDGNTGRIYAEWQSFSTGLEIDVFGLGTQPGLDPPAVSQVTTSGARVSTNVAPGDTPVSEVHAEYCVASDACDDFPFAGDGDNNPWHVVPAPVDHQGIPAHADTTVHDDLAGLDPNKAYKVRAYATNGSVENVSPAVTFTTEAAPPDVTTVPASEITPDGAVLNGTIDPRGSQTSYYFDFGPTSDYGMRTPQSSQAVAGSGRRPLSVARTVSGLTPSTSYHFRLVAQNQAGTIYGADKTFTTADTRQPTRAYEEVTPVDKRGGTVAQTFGLRAKSDGSAVAYVLQSAPVDAPTSAFTSKFMSYREATDWSDWTALDPPIDMLRAGFAALTLGISSDFTRALVASNRKLTTDATEGAANLYVENIRTGGYSLVGSSSADGALTSMVGLGVSSLFLGGASDFNWIVFASSAPLLPGAPASAVYKWTSDSGLALVSRLPDGSVPTGNVQQQTATQTPTRYVSDDGAVIAFALSNGEKGVYRRAGGQTSAISVSRVVGDPATPQPGWVAGVSRDGDSMVFVSGRLLPAANPGALSLYRYRASSNSLIYLGELASSAQPSSIIGVSDDASTTYFDDNSETVVSRNGALHTVTPDRPQSSAYMSPGGRFLAWVGADGDVHRYDAVAGDAVCVSCKAGGEPAGAILSDAQRVPGNTRPTVVTDNGTVYFSTNARLVSADRNGSRDVYSYDAGAVTLISPGDGPYDASYADSSEDGRDVFFTTRQGLVGQDVDGKYDVYDARVGGGFPGQSPTVIPPCQKAECGPTSNGPVASPRVVDPPQPGSRSVSRTNQVKAKMSLRKVTFTAKSMRLTFTASQRGRVRVTGSRVVTTVRNVGKSGTYSMSVSLSKKARSLKRHHRRFKVTAKVTFAGGWSTTTTKINRTVRG